MKKEILEYRTKFYLILEVVILISSVIGSIWYTISFIEAKGNNNSKIILIMLILFYVLSILFLLLIIVNIIKGKVAIWYNNDGIIINNKNKDFIKFEDITKCRYSVDLNRVIVFNLRIRCGKVFIETKNKKYCVDFVKNARDVANKILSLKDK